MDAKLRTLFTMQYKVGKGELRPITVAATDMITAIQTLRNFVYNSEGVLPTITLVTTQDQAVLVYGE